MERQLHFIGFALLTLVVACDGPMKPSGGAKPPVNAGPEIEPGTEPEPQVEPQPPALADPGTDKATPPAVILRDLPIEVALTYHDSSTPPVPDISYADIKPILDEHCVHCHLPIARGGGLDLSVVPFVSALRDETAAQLAQRVVDRMRDANFPMPPSAPRPEEEIASIEGWIASGMNGPDGGTSDGPGQGDVTGVTVYFRAKHLQAEHQFNLSTGGTAQVFQATLAALVVGQEYVFRVILTNAAGEVVQTSQATRKIDSSADLGFSFTVNR